ncbi:MAG: DUF4339 domain-containing protein [Chthoniobacterales bacterium]
MNVFIARDGSIIGEYPRAELESLARRGTIQRADHYWHDGMDNWLPLPDLIGGKAWEPLPPVPDPAPARAVVEPAAKSAPETSPRSPLSPAVRYGIIAGGVLLLLLLLFFLVKPRHREQIAPTEIVVPQDAQTSNQIRDSAAADLRAKIDRLPGTATPPVNTFYYDVRVNMNRTIDTRAPWTAIMRGFENVIDPQTQQTLKRTEFALTVDFRDGQWIYKSYHAATSNLGDGTTTEIDSDQQSPTPPSIVGMMGLKTKP